MATARGDDEQSIAMHAVTLGLCVKVTLQSPIVHDEVIRGEGSIVENPSEQPTTSSQAIPSQSSSNLHILLCSNILHKGFKAIIGLALVISGRSVEIASSGKDKHVLNQRTKTKIKGTKKPGPDCQELIYKDKTLRNLANISKKLRLPISIFIKRLNHCGGNANKSDTGLDARYISSQTEMSFEEKTRNIERAGPSQSYSA